MAKGMCVGDRVCAKKILGARRATAKLGKQVSKVELRGRVTGIVGAGPVASVVGQTCDHQYFAECVRPLKLYLHTFNSMEYMSGVIIALLATF